MAKGGETVRVRAWDLPTRLFHWALVITFAGSWYTAEQGMTEWHERLGLATLALLAFRLIWGFVGSGTARFAGFVRGPLAAWRYARETLAGRHPAYLGHNPLGGWSVLALLFAMAAQAGMGLFATDEILYEGPLYAPGRPRDGVDADRPAPPVLRRDPGAGGDPRHRGAGLRPAAQDRPGPSHGHRLEDDAGRAGAGAHRAHPDLDRGGAGRRLRARRLGDHPGQARRRAAWCSPSATG